MRLFVTFLALLCFSSSVCQAQRSRYRQNQKKEKVTVESLIASYRFSEAVELLEKDIAKAKRRRKPTDELESKMDRVHSLQVMLSATEKVNFIDSVVVNKDEFLSIFHLGLDCGMIAAPKFLLPEEIMKGKNFGELAYRNGLNDKIYFSVQNDSAYSSLQVSARVGESWSQPKPLKGVVQDSVKQDFPYVLSDGVTLYFAEENAEGLGGYDIYVTRYNTDTGSYLKAENIGMPFNSMANDYMYAVDENNNLGWFVSDRNQPEGKVCIYIFQPNSTRELYNSVAMGDEAMRKLALIHSIDDARLDKVSLEKARARLQKVATEPIPADFDKVRYVINDDIVYHSIYEFKNDEAMKVATQWKNEAKQLSIKENALNSLRKNYRHGSATNEDKRAIQQLESIIGGLRSKVSTLAKRMREVELGK